MKPLTVSIGSATCAGMKTINQDALGHWMPQTPRLQSKGIALAIADGISSSEVSQLASETAITQFLEDYYRTSDTWSVKMSAENVIKSINANLYSQSQNEPDRFNKDKGYVCTFSAIILRSNSAHLFHLGDSRIYQLRDETLDQLTTDHRHVVSSQESYLSRALGINPILELDYQAQSIAIDDVFILATDGVYEHIEADQFHQVIASADSLDKAAEHLINLALQNGSQDNLSVQIVRIDQMPSHQTDDNDFNLRELPFPPPLRERMRFDGYEIFRPIQISSRSHVFLVYDLERHEKLVMKTPSMELQDDTTFRETFMLEEWIAKRIDHPNVAKIKETTRGRSYLYLLMEYIEGKSLEQWMRDHPTPSLEQVRYIIEQIANGLQAFHRKAMIHQDIRPANIMIDDHDRIKIIDFGSTQVAGVSHLLDTNVLRGTLRYSAPEYFLGHSGTERSDIYALGVIAYQMLSANHFPYSRKITEARSISAQRKLTYRSLITDQSEVPVWVDDALQKALHIDPAKRYDEVSEFIYDLHHPNPAFLKRTQRPILQRNPIMFWQGMSFLLVMVIVCMILDNQS
ncbi:bifunctional protein-serine/threonine kinase/phosphatase [Marinomonas sp. TW1]|uniref:bifunctional protein-serine/threonine kinase/phosphatase n=1 Tax=Marinomonas sp. TW1 TaxID=1561203 RepID=UPI0007AF3B65|nr:bifunctional protein-serine/threonine kinase/phosphatase [Marinomonas sp. TW1]KZN14867.1 protein kinase [Marinomonas sp. TW1]